MSATDSEHRHKLIPLLGPAFVAAVAYVDPGNVAANITAGARYGYLLVWVLVASNIFAMVIQYLSAKLGLVTGQSLPALLGNRMMQFKLIAVAVAVINALAFRLCFGGRLHAWRHRPPPLGRAMAALSLLAWPTILVAGRMIAYT